MRGPIQSTSSEEVSDAASDTLSNLTDFEDRQTLDDREREVLHREKSTNMIDFVR